MSIKYYANRVKETSTTVGAGNLILGGSPSGYKTFLSTIGAGKKLTYYIYRDDTSFEWEIGNGYILSSGGINQLVRENVISSTNGNNLVGFTGGTKYIETILSEDRVNTSFVNVDEKSTNFTADYIPALYIIDASVSNVQINLPPVSGESDQIVLGFLLSKTIGSAYQQLGAITLIPDGTETVNNDASFEVSILNDYIQLVSVPSENRWYILNPIQDSTNPFGDDGYIQFKYDNSFSGINSLFWDNSSKSLLIGNSGNATADIVLASSGQSVIFNQRLYDADFRIAGTGVPYLFYVDGGNNRVGINTSNVTDALTINANNNNGITITKSGIGPQITIGNPAVSGLVNSNKIGSIVYSGLNSTNSPVEYIKINGIINSPANGSESSSITFDVINNGILQQVAELNTDSISIGLDNSNINGTIIGATSSNQGTNIGLGYYNNIYGEKCIIIGDNNIVSSGTFGGGAIGSDHSASGNNIWILGGSGLSATGNNKVYVCLDSNNYLNISGSGDLIYNTSTNNDSSFKIINQSLVSSGNTQSIDFIFNNNSAVAKTGLSFGNIIENNTSGSESSRLFASIIFNNNSQQIMDIGSDRIVIGPNSYTNDNMIYGKNNIVANSGNLLVGIDILASGTDNILVGNNIVCSGTDNSIFGQNNLCTTNNADNIILVGNDNQASEDYAISIGNSNANSGLRSVSCGFSNGSHGEYSVAVGSYNFVEGNGSVAIGRNNDVETTDMYANICGLGISNYGLISNTGLIVGLNNELYGSGGIIIGLDIWSSGTNNIAIGSNIVATGVNNLLLGNDISFSGSNTLILEHDNTKLQSNTLDINANTINVSGQFNISNTGIGIVYTNYPYATGVSTNLVIENNIIKASKINNGVRITNFSGPSVTLTTADKKFQLLDPSSSGNYSLILSVTNMIQGDEFTIRNTSDDLTNESINIIDNYTSNNISTLGGIANTYRSCNVVFDGTQWRLVLLGE